MLYSKSFRGAHALIITSSEPVASPAAEIVGDPRRIVTEALEVCPAPVVARRLGMSERTVTGWRTGNSLPNLDHLCRAPESFIRRITVLLGAHVDARQIVRRDPREALHLATLSLGMLLVQIDRKPLDRMTPDEKREVREEAARLEEWARQIRQAASEPAVVDGAVSK